MEYKKFIFILSVLVMRSISVVAQNNADKPVNDLDSALIEQMSISVRQEVQLFTSYLSSIVAPKRARNKRERETVMRNRELLKQEALDLFVGKGDKYDVVIYDFDNNPLDTIHHRPVIMQTMSLSNPIPKDTAMVKYLSYKVKQANSGLITGTSLHIISYDWTRMKVDPPMKIGDGTYVIDVYFQQEFGFVNRELRLKKIDITTKRVSCFVYVSETQSGTEFIIRLGDIRAEEIERWN